MVQVVEQQQKSSATSNTVQPQGKQTVKRSKRIVVDYETELTIQEAYEKYGGKIVPLVVAAEGWTNDYCFIITEISGRSSYGFTFQKGKLYSERARFNLSRTVKIYNGPSKKAIENYYETYINE